jgi:alpha-1,2-mannosyltransferase
VAGIATGLAAGIKLTPLIFVVFLLITRRVRAAVTAAGTFAATIAVGAVVLPSQSRAYWPGGVFWRQDRIGNPANPADQSLAGAVARLAGTGHPAQACWLALALVTGLAGLAVAVSAHRRGRQLAGVTYCAITGLPISPFSWTHHWVWAVPLCLMLTSTARRRRSPWHGLAAAAAAAVFSGFLPLPAPGNPLSPGRLLQGDLYVLCGLSVLAGAAVALARDSAARRTRTHQAQNRTVTSNQAGEHIHAA